MMCLSTDTTPIFPTKGQVSCFDYVDEFFCQKIPLIHQQKAVFTYMQKESQDATELREELRNISDLGDVAGMDLPGGTLSDVHNEHPGRQVTRKT